jgi:uncharacterized protein (TIGR02646 family)
MIRENKAKEPDWFTAWKKGSSEDWRPCFDALGSSDKIRLKESLIKEQGYLCCYCGQKINLDDSHIEHFRSQSDFNELSIEYDNLFISCIKDPPVNNLKYCGHAKKNVFNEELYLSPFDIDCESKFDYDLIGIVDSQDILPSENILQSRLSRSRSK